VYKQDLRPAAEDRLKKRLVLSNVAEQEGLVPEPEAIDEQISEMAEGMGEQADAMRAMLNSPEGRLSVANDLLISMAQERVVLIGKGEAPPLESEAEAPPLEDEDEAGAETETETEGETEAETGVEAEEDGSVPESVPEAKGAEDVATSEQPASESSEEDETVSAGDSESEASE
jgi:trigger factor